MSTPCCDTPRQPGIVACQEIRVLAIINGVRWFAVRGPHLATLTIRGDQPLPANVLALPCDELDRRPPGTWCSSDSVPRGYVSVTIDAVQSGLGGTDGWRPLGRPLERSRIPVATLRYAFALDASPPAPANRGARVASATVSPVVD